MHLNNSIMKEHIISPERITIDDVKRIVRGATVCVCLMSR